LPNLNLGTRNSFFEERHHQISICREYRNCISGKDDAALESKLNANNVAFTKWELLLQATLDLALAN
jgi:hypothetical protein